MTERDEVFYTIGKVFQTGDQLFLLAKDYDDSLTVFEGFVQEVEKLKELIGKALNNGVES